MPVGLAQVSGTPLCKTDSLRSDSFDMKDLSLFFAAQQFVKIDTRSRMGRICVILLTVFQDTYKKGLALGVV